MSKIVFQIRHPIWSNSCGMKYLTHICCYLDGVAGTGWKGYSYTSLLRVIRKFYISSISFIKYKAKVFLICLLCSKCFEKFSWKVQSH